MRPFIHDQYAPLSYKAEALGDGVTRRPGAASWVPQEEERRLAAYQVLAAFIDNASRYYLPETLSNEQIAKYREYGHAARLVAGGVSALLGDEQTLYAPGALESLDLELAEDQAAPTEALAAQAALDYLREWAVAERLWLEMAEAENDAVGLGDSVWTVYWDAEKQRPRIRTYDPGFYFPVLDSGPDGDYPPKLHLAWEEKFPLDGRVEVHRLTWELGPIRPAQDPDEPFDGLNYLYTEEGRPIPQAGDRLLPDGRIVRDYPWNDEPSDLTCHFTHAIWNLDKVKGTVLDLDLSKARFEYVGGQWQRELDLRLDYLPVLHVPNTPARREHFGRSLLTRVAQILDDLASNDTDIAVSGALVGSATLVLKGGPAGDIDAGPGATLRLDQGGSAEYLDVSKNLDALLKHKTNLKDDLSENSRISKATLGRVDGSNSVSGLALALSFSPTEGLVREMRGVRDEKYPLLLKFVLRMAQAAGLLDAGPTPQVHVQFGSFQPADKAQAIKLVTEAVKGRVMSTHSAVLYLQGQGFPIDDAVAEVERIRREDFAAAVQLVDATGDVELARDLLGLAPGEDVEDDTGGA